MKLDTPLRAEPDKLIGGYAIRDAKGQFIAVGLTKKTAEAIVGMANQYEKLLETVRWYAEYGETTEMEYDLGKHAKAALAAGGKDL